MQRGCKKRKDVRGFKDLKVRVEVLRLVYELRRSAVVVVMVVVRSKGKGLHTGAGLPTW